MQRCALGMRFPQCIDFENETCKPYEDERQSNLDGGIECGSVAFNAHVTANESDCKIEQHRQINHESHTSLKREKCKY
jgi:hypothetical protein